MVETATFDADSINERVTTLLSLPFSAQGVSMTELKELITFIEDVTALNRSGQFKIHQNEAIPLANVYADAKIEYGSRRRLEVATGLTYAEIMRNIDMA